MNINERVNFTINALNNIPSGNYYLCTGKEFPEQCSDLHSRNIDCKGCEAMLCIRKKLQGIKIYGYKITLTEGS